LAITCTIALHAQVPTKCLEIESILVDACTSSDTICAGSTEGMNEMARFIIGPDPIDIQDLQFGFDGSTFLGISQNDTTAALTAQLNAGIQGCGYLLEPPAGTIPAGKRVIFVTSTEMCVLANSFAALDDTLYIIYQDPGNTLDHFRNNDDLIGQPVTTTPAAPTLRSLRINLASTGCGDTATYDAGQLTNIYGTYGGSSAENDGATADFTWPGGPVVSYVNYGCQADFTPTIPTVVSGGGTVPCGSTTTLVGSVSGEYVSVIWSGGGGTFSDPVSTVTSYTPGPGSMGDEDLSFCAVVACGDTVCAQVTVSVGGTTSIIGDTVLCGTADTTLLIGSGADSYEWSTGATTDTITVDAPGAGTYWVVGTTACGTDTAYVTVSVSLLMDSLAFTDVTCKGDSDGSAMIFAYGGIVPYSYLWSTDSTDAAIDSIPAGVYNVTVTDAGGCSHDTSVVISQPPVLVALVAGDTTICPGGQADFSVQGSGGTPGYTYTWSPAAPPVSVTQTTVYSAVVTDSLGCESEPALVTVTIPPGQEVLIGSTPLDGCAPHCVTFSVTSPAPDNYAWDFGDGSISTSGVVQHCYDSIGVFTASVAVTQSSGCPGFTSTFGPFTIGDSLIADFTWTPETPRITNPEVQFNDGSFGANTWAWQFGDPSGSTSTEPSPVFTYDAINCYPVMLTVTNTVGCVDSVEKLVCVLGPDTLFVPNVFTPNGDGQNDEFRVTGGKLIQLEVWIFNRWGQQVAVLERPKQSWDGRSIAGEVLSAGTYFYTLRATTGEGEVLDRSGTITLVR
jgi:gliding motility-associated-like protein